MKKTNTSELKYEIEQLSINKTNNCNEDTEVTEGKYRYQDIYEVKKKLYAELHILKHDLSILIHENIFNNEELLLCNYNKIFEIKESISDLLNLEEEEIDMLSIEYKTLVKDIVNTILGEYRISYAFFFTKTGYKLYLYDSLSKAADYTCSIEYIKKDSYYVTTQRKETEFLARD